MSAFFNNYESPSFVMERQGSFTYNAAEGSNHCGQTTGNRKLDYHVEMRCDNLDGRGFCLDQNDVRALFYSRRVRNSWSSFSCERMAFDVCARLVAACHLQLPGYPYSARARIHRGGSRTGVICEIPDVPRSEASKRERFAPTTLANALSPAVCYYIVRGPKTGRAYTPSDFMSHGINFDAWVTRIRSEAAGKLRRQQSLTADQVSAFFSPTTRDVINVVQESVFRTTPSPAIEVLTPDSPVSGADASEIAIDDVYQEGCGHANVSPSP